MGLFLLVFRHDKYINFHLNSIIDSPYYWLIVKNYHSQFVIESNPWALLPRPRRGLRGIVFTLSVCPSVRPSVCPANILVFYLSAIRRDIDLKFIQDTNRVVLNSLKNINLHRLKVNVTGTVHCFLKVQSYHNNRAIEKFQYFVIDTS